jgi:hypothetical protein
LQFIVCEENEGSAIKPGNVDTVLELRLGCYILEAYERRIMDKKMRPNNSPKIYE